MLQADRMVCEQGAHFCKHLLSRELVYENIDRHFLFFGCNNVEGRGLSAKLLSSLSAGSGNCFSIIVVCTGLSCWI